MQAGDFTADEITGHTGRMVKIVTLQDSFPDTLAISTLHFAFLK